MSMSHSNQWNKLFKKCIGYMCNASLNIVYSIICIFEGLREGYNFVLHLYTVK